MKSFQIHVIIANKYPSTHPPCMKENSDSAKKIEERMVKSTHPSANGDIW